jgi:hypothetical protein
VWDWITHYASEIWSFVAGLIGGGAIGSLLTVRVTRKKRASGQGNVVEQSKISAGGDVVGRDKINSTNKVGR